MGIVNRRKAGDNEAPGVYVENITDSENHIAVWMKPKTNRIQIRFKIVRVVWSGIHSSWNNGEKILKISRKTTENTERNGHPGTSAPLRDVKTRKIRPRLRRAPTVWAISS